MYFDKKSVDGRTDDQVASNFDFDVFCDLHRAKTITEIERVATAVASRTPQ
jgi:hypothetical protein